MANLTIHLTKEVLEAFHKNLLSTEDYFEVLEHISHCTHCSSLFAQSFSEEMLIKTPPGLKESILEKASKKAVFQLPLPWQSPQKRQLFFYSMKVCAAMCGALLIMVSSMHVQLPETTQTKNLSINLDFLENFNTSMREFSDGVNQQMNSFLSIYDTHESSKEDSTTKTEVTQ